VAAEVCAEDWIEVSVMSYPDFQKKSHEEIVEDRLSNINDELELMSRKARTIENNMAYLLMIIVALLALILWRVW
jgi:hypothetical protein